MLDAFLTYFGWGLFAILCVSFLAGMIGWFYVFERPRL